MGEFSNIASYYDLMTGYSSRLINDFGIIKHIVDRYGVKKALDAGCGTGVHTIILSKIGVDVTGLDASEEMLDLARANAKREGIEVPFEREYFESMPHSWDENFDTVFCMANSLVGVETAERLTLALRSFYRVLQPGGRAVIQLLNFVDYRRNNRRIIKVSTVENYTFVRFFDFEEHNTRLNVIVIKHDMGKADYHIDSQKILPVNTEVFEVASKICGFSEPEYYSDLSLSEKYSISSGNLVVVLNK